MTTLDTEVDGGHGSMTIDELHVEWHRLAVRPFTNFKKLGEIEAKIGAIVVSQPRKPGPEATTWENDYRLSRAWLRIALEVWAEIPNEWYGDNVDPNTLVKKVQLIVAEIARLRAIACIV